MSDLISRQAAIDALAVADAKKGWRSLKFSEMHKCLSALPSVQPQKGKWIKDRDGIYHCSCCGTDYLMYDAVVQDTHYCPNCGCRMEEGDAE